MNTTSSNLTLDGRKSEEWEGWMDWERMSDQRTSTDDAGGASSSPPPLQYLMGAHQLPSPGASSASEPALDSAAMRALPEEENSSNSLQNDAPVQKPDAKRKKTAQAKKHSIVEKRYRTNLNQKIVELGKRLPKSKDLSEKQFNKGTVLAEAMAYVDHLEKRNNYLECTNNALRQQSQQQQQQQSESSPPEASIQSEDRSSVDEEAENATSAENDSNIDAEHEPTSPITNGEGMIKVPDEWRRLWRGELGANAAAASSPSSNAESASTPSDAVRVRGGNYIGKIMMGSLAVIMLMDQVARHDSHHSEDRGLFALPFTNYLPTLCGSACSNFVITNPIMAPFLKVFLLFGVLGLILFVYLFTSQPPSRKLKTSAAPRPAPSVCSPLELRQRAFLTSIQTIWVPQHHVLPELLALNVETAAYIVRQLLGWRTYSWLTGRSEEEEVARVRAWDIAIDAQLSGGDAEISKSRLVLSLWASGTLPRSPARFMLKALHIRILFWRPSRSKLVNEYFHALAHRLAHWQWNKGVRLQQKRQLHGHASSFDVEPLTPHLAALLTKKYEDVMGDDAISRAHDLAWNSTSVERNTDEVTEDTAMRGPLDALAVWYSLSQVQKCCCSVLKSPGGWDLRSLNLRALAAAEKCAPAGSMVKAKAMVLVALLKSSRRTASLTAFVKTFLPSTHTLPTSVGELCKMIKQSTIKIHEGDLHDTLLSLRCVELTDDLQRSPILAPEHSEELSQLVLSASRQEQRIGLLALASLKLTIVVFFDRSGPAQITTLPEDITTTIKHLFERRLRAETDTDTSAALKRAAALVEGRRITNTKTRRQSAASNDTGYASMDHDDADK